MSTRSQGGLRGAEFGVDDLIAQRFRSRRLELGAGTNTRSALAGGCASRFRGRGMDFAETRRYSPGDDIRLMDWRVTARTGNPHTKMYQEERERPVFAVVDFNPSMFFGTRVAFKSVAGAECAALLCWAAVRSGDRVGAVAVGADGCHERRPAGGRRGVLGVLNALVVHGGAGPAGTTATPLSESLLHVRRVTRPGSLIVVVSDYYALDAEFERHLSRVRQHNDVMLCWIVDPLEAQAPPSGRYVISDGTRRAPLRVETDRDRRAYDQAFAARQTRLELLARERSIPLVRIDTGDDVAVVLERALIGGRPMSPGTLVDAASDGR